jgi:hypothetical protein
MSLQRLTSRLQTTPRRAAIQYLDWAQDALHNRNRCPVEGLLNKMRQEIRANGDPDGSIRCAAQQEFARLCVFFLATAHSFVNGLCRLLYLAAAGKAFHYSGIRIVSGPRFSKELIEQYQCVCLDNALIEKIERDLLGAGVLATDIREIFLLAKRDVYFTLKLVSKDFTDRIVLCDPTEIAKQAEKKHSESMSALCNRELDFDSTILVMPFWEASESLRSQAAITELLLNQLEAQRNAKPRKGSRRCADK